MIYNSIKTLFFSENSMHNNSCISDLSLQMNLYTKALKDGCLLYSL